MKFFDIFRQLEAENNLLGLNCLADILRSILFLNDTSILEFVLDISSSSATTQKQQQKTNKENFLSVCGILEYDSSLKQRADYRNFVQHRSRLVQVVLMDADVRAACRLLFKLKLLRDVMLHPAVDEPGVTALSSMIHFSTSDILYQLFHDQCYLAKVFKVIRPNIDVSHLLREEAPIGPQLPPSAPIGPQLPPSAPIGPQLPPSAPIGPQLPPSAPIGPQLPPLDDALGGETESRSPRDAIRFLKELFFLSRSLPPDKRLEIYRPLLVNKMRKVFSSLLLMMFTGAADGHQQEAELAAEVMYCVSITGPSQTRGLMLEGPVAVTTTPAANNNNNNTQQRQQPVQHYNHLSNTQPLQQPVQDIIRQEQSLLFQVIRYIVHNPSSMDSAVLEQLGEALKSLLQTGGGGGGGGAPAVANLSAAETQDREKFLTMFYDHFISWLLVPFGNNSTTNISFSNSSKRIVIDVLTLCVQCHTYRMKYYMMRNNVMSLLLTHCFSSNNTTSTSRHLQLSAVKFIRSVLSVKDEFYYRHIVKMNVLQPLFDSNLFAANAAAAAAASSVNQCCNLLQSSVFDLLHYIKVEGIKVLIIHIVEMYKDKLQDIQTVDIFDQLNIRYQQIKDGSFLHTTSTSSSTSSDVTASSALVTVKVVANRKFLDSDTEDDYFFGEDRPPVPAALRGENIFQVLDGVDQNTGNKMSRAIIFKKPTPVETQFDHIHSQPPIIQVGSVSGVGCDNNNR